MVQLLAVLTMAVGSMIAGACGDDATGGDGDASPPSADSGVFDAAPTADGGGGGDAAVGCEVSAAGNPGSSCTENSDCDSAADAGDGFCATGDNALGVVSWPPKGYCLLLNGCDSDLACPGASVCVTAGTTPACVAACCPDGTCGAADELCSERLFSQPVESPSCFPGTASAKDGDPCTHNGECNRHSICLPDPYNHPGGYCVTAGCTEGDDSTCAPEGDGHCVDLDSNPMTPSSCVDACASDTDCRESEGYRCFDGTSLGRGFYCRHPRAGEECAVADDCGGAPWECQSGAGFPGGYCTVSGCTVGDATTCGFGADCYDPDAATTDDQYCAQLCPLDGPNPCRDGYVCTDVGGGNNQGVCLSP